MLNTLGMPLWAEYLSCDSFLSEQIGNLLYVQLEPLAGQEERHTLLVLRDYSVPEFASPWLTFITLCHLMSFFHSFLHC